MGPQLGFGIKTISERKNISVLAVIIVSQFCCTSLWFASNAVISNLISIFRLQQSALSYFTSAVQLGFICGTLGFAILMVVDRFAPSKVFFTCAILGAISNVALVFENNSFLSLLMLRFLTGFFLAGIYPVGMKIAADYFEEGLGKSLGYLVGALVLGTAFPHLLNGSNLELAWKAIIFTTSILAIGGGTLMWVFVPRGPHCEVCQKIDPRVIGKIFSPRPFRSAAFGYFGHMWELYTFWAFVPVLISLFNERNPDTNLNVALLSAAIIGGGGLACAAAGSLSLRHGAAKIAYTSIFASGICCLVFPLMFHFAPPLVFVVFLLFWGWVVASDSPMFSTLVARNAIPECRGTALAIVTSIGFGTTIISIQLINFLLDVFQSPTVFIVLAIGPLLGLVVRERFEK